MILVTPILTNITTFDPAYNTEISFLYTGGQIDRSHIVVKDASTSEQVYELTQTGRRLSINIPANSLLPGQYLAQIQVYDDAGNSSELSSPVLFYCYSTPRMTLEGLSNTDPNTLNGANLVVKGLFSQAENDKLTEVAYYMYDNNKILISQSKTMYDNDIMDTTDKTSLKSYTFYGLQNLRTYYVKCVGKTAHGMIADTGYIEIVVNYLVQPNNILLELTNHQCDGYISIDCNIIDVGHTEVGEYSIQDGLLTLPFGSSVHYDSGFSLSDNMSMLINVKNAPINTNLLEMKIPEGNMYLSVEEIADDYYGVLTVNASLGNYKIYTAMPGIGLIDETSSLIVDCDGKCIVYEKHNKPYNKYMLVFDVRRKNNLYSLNIHYENDGISVV